MNVRPLRPEEAPLAAALAAEAGCAPCEEGRALVLEKGAEAIGLCRFAPEGAAVRLVCLCILPRWQGKGYGSFLLRRALHEMGAYSGAEIYAAAPQGGAADAVLKKFGFAKQARPAGETAEFCRRTARQLTSLSISHELLAARVRPGDFVIDATAGRGRDTAFLCRLVGPKGRVLAMDIQPEAVQTTSALLKAEGLDAIGRAVQADHARLAAYAAPASADAVVFNFGWLPGGDHALFTTPKTSLPALEAALRLLKPGGALVASIYHGGANGTEEKDALLPWFAALDPARYTVLQCSFANREGRDPLVMLVQA